MERDLRAEKASQRERRYWDRNARRYDRSMLLLGRPLPRMVELAGEAVAGCERVLEVAAGTGLVTPSLAARAGEVVSTDYSEPMVARLAARVREQGLSNVRCEVADIYALRWEAGRFDAVVAANVLHLLPDLEGALASLRRVLRPGGKLVAPTFLHDETVSSRIASRFFALTGFPGHRRFRASTLRSALEGAGLRIVRTETIPGLFPIGYVEGVFP